MRARFNGTFWQWAVGLTVGATAYAQQGPAAFGLSGSLFNADGTPVSGASVNFRVEIWDQNNVCRLYAEDHLGEDLSVNKGAFALVVGAGTSRQNFIAGTTSLDARVFLNPGSVSPFAGCASPPTLSTGDARNVRVSYDLGSGMTALTPDVPLVASAYAIVAETLQGKTSAEFLQVNDAGSSALSQANTEYAFSTLNWPKLKSLIDGSSTQYLPSSPTAPVDYHNQRLVNVANPTAAQDAATKTYVDTMFSGKALDVSATGPSTGDGRAIVWDAVNNRWTTGNPTAGGPAGGDLTGTYPNPTLAAGAVSTSKLTGGAVTSAKLNTSGVAINRLVMTDATTGATLQFATCAQNEILKFDLTTGWACATVASVAPVTSVAGKTGAVTLNAADVSGLGTAALRDHGTAANQIVALDGGARLPAVDGSQLRSVSASALQGRAIASTAPGAGQVLGWNASSTRWEPTSPATGSVTSVTAGTGLLGGAITATGTLTVDVGSAALKIVQENANAQIAQTLGSAALPAYAFAGNLNTGLFSPGANQLALSTNGTAALTITAGGRVGVGTSAPLAGFDIALTGTAASALIVPRDTAGNRPGGVNGMLRYNTTAGVLETFAAGVWTSLATGAAGATQWTTNGTAITYATGNVGIGTTTAPTSRLEVKGTIVSRTNVVASGATIDLSLANTHLVRAPGGSLLTVQNPADGASYTVIVSDTANSRTYTFAGCTNSYFSPSNAATVLGARTTYTLLVVNDGGNTDCYVSWVSGFM